MLVGRSFRRSFQGGWGEIFSRKKPDASLACAPTDQGPERAVCFAKGRSLAWESTGCGGMQVPGRAFLGGAEAGGRRRCSCVAVPVIDHLPGVGCGSGQRSHY